MNYRKDARPSCQWCGGAFDAAELSFDALGRVTCRGCYDRAASKQADIDEKRARRRVRISRVAGAIGLATVAAIYVFFYALPKHERAKARAAAAALQLRSGERVLQIQASALLPKGSATTTRCDDAAIRARTRDATVAWSEGTSMNGAVVLHDAQSRTFSRVDAASRFVAPGAPEPRQALADLERVGIAVAVMWNGGFTDPALPEPRLTVNDTEEDRGHVVVISLAEGRATPICWAPIVLGIDAGRSRKAIHDGADVQRAAQASLDTITKAIRLEPM